MGHAAAKFLDCITSHADQQGFCAPPELQWYLAIMLEQHLQDRDLVTDLSFIERYYRVLRDPDPVGLQTFADQVLLAISIMPRLGSRRGISSVYYQTIGSQAYLVWGLRCQDQRGQDLSSWFLYLNQFLISLFQDIDQRLCLFDPYSDK
jgi:hypothetical protein